MSMAPLNLTRDINGLNAFGATPYTIKANTTLSANAEQTWTVPATNNSNFANIAVAFSPDPGSSVWIAFNATASIPGSSPALTDSELNPQMRYVNPGDVIHFITDEDQTRIGWTCYAVS